MVLSLPAVNNIDVQDIVDEEVLRAEFGTASLISAERAPRPAFFHRASDHPPIEFLVPGILYLDLNTVTTPSQLDFDLEIWILNSGF